MARVVAKKEPKEITLAAATDLLWRIREKRLGLQRQIDDIAKEESAIRERLIRDLPKDDATGISGKLASARIETRWFPKVDDWDAFYKHVGKTKSYELLQRRLTDSAVRERWDAGEAVPGVGKVGVPVVSLTRVRGR